MTRLPRRLFPILLVAGLAGAAMQQTTDITFDDVADGATIDTHYPGLTFSCDGAHCASASVFARATPLTKSSPNSASVAATGGVALRDDFTGRIRIDLAAPAKSVSIDAKSIPVAAMLGPVEQAVLTAQDATGAVVGVATGTVQNAFETLTVAASGATISRVFLGVPTKAGIAEASGQFDNLKIDRGPAPVAWHFPDRATMLWILFGIATLFVIVGITARRRG